MSKAFLDLHVIQSVPPSCLNRDDTGSPKTAIYGGVRRARVSSQCWKHAMRASFKEHFNADKLGIRTKRIPGIVKDEIMRQDPSKTEQEALQLACQILTVAGIIKDKKDDNKSGKKKETETEQESAQDKKNEVDALFIISQPQIELLAQLAFASPKKNVTNKSIKEALDEKESIEAVLFGRMVASNANLNCDASAQVAHAISTHRVENEFDFFTAVDDCKKSDSDDAGAGHLGTVEFNSATLYRYATVAVHDLYKQLLSDDAALEEAIREFIRAFVESLPTGKQNTFAANTLPEALLVCVRTDRPVSFVNAFEKPITGNEGFAEKSVRAMVDYASSVNDFCDEPFETYMVGSSESLGNLSASKKMSFKDVIETVGKNVAVLVKEI